LVRIFSVLVVFSVLLLAASFVVGLQGGDFNALAGRLVELERRARAQRNGNSSELVQAQEAAAEAEKAFRAPRWWMTTHLMLGSAAAITTVLVNSIAVTYFIGTSRWCKEVCETYKIEGELAEQSAKLKRSAFPWALAGILAVIATVGLGAAADPSGANFRASASFVAAHYFAAMFGLLVVIASFFIQIGRISENSGVIDEILAEVQRIRAAKNLPTGNLAET
jgi:uncharacterized membrane protein